MTWVSGMPGRAKVSPTVATDGTQRRPDGQPGNTTTQTRGRHGREKALFRKFTCDRLKLAAHTLRAHAEAEGRYSQSHARPMRQDQVDLLKREEPEGRGIVPALMVDESIKQ